MYLLGGENEDLIQEGMIGLIKAVRDYRPEQGASLSKLCRTVCFAPDVQCHRSIKEEEAHAAELLRILYESGETEGDEKRCL